MSEDKQKAIFSKNLNSYIEASGKTQLEIAKNIGVSPQTFNTWCKGIAIPRMGKVQALADYFHISKSDLIEEKASSTQPTTLTAHFDSNEHVGVIIPVLSRLAADIPLTAAEYIIDTEEITQDMASDGEYFGLQVKGDSMEPRISNGDVVIARKQSDADDGDLVIALINGDDAVVKRLKKYACGIALISSNPTYDPLYFSNEEIESKPVEIIGKVKELRAKF